MDFRLHSMVGQLRIERPFIFPVVSARFHALELQWTLDDDHDASLRYFVEGVLECHRLHAGSCAGGSASGSTSHPCALRVASIQVVVCNNLSCFTASKSKLLHSNWSS